MGGPDPVTEAPVYATNIVRVMLAARRHRAVVLPVVATLLLAGVVKLATVSVDPDVLDLLPQTGAAVRDFRRYLAGAPLRLTGLLGLELRPLAGDGVDRHVGDVGCLAARAARVPPVPTATTPG